MILEQSCTFKLHLNVSRGTRAAQLTKNATRIILNTNVLDHISFGQFKIMLKLRARIQT